VVTAGRLFDVAEFSGERLDLRGDDGGEFGSAGRREVRAIAVIFDRVKGARI
jgi:hypothetical protein